MNHLSIRTEREWFGLYFDLLVDGVPVGEALGSSDSGIPYWLVTDGLARDKADGKCLIAVCGCGEEGCGHTRCNVRREGEVVVLDGFVGERDHPRPQLRWVFSVAEFDVVERELTRLASADRNK